MKSFPNGSNVLSLNDKNNNNKRTEKKDKKNSVFFFMTFKVSLRMPGSWTVSYAGLISGQKSFTIVFLPVYNKFSFSSQPYSSCISINQINHSRDTL